MSRRPPKEAPDPIDIHVGQRIKARRVGLRISQSEIGKALEVTFQQIQKYENGANRVGASNLYKMSKALNVEVSYFFDDMAIYYKKEGIEYMILKLNEFNYFNITKINCSSKAIIISPFVV